MSSLNSHTYYAYQLLAIHLDCSEIDGQILFRHEIASQ